MALASLDITLQNVKVNGDEIEGDAHIVAKIIGKHIDDTKHFKTKNGADVDFDLVPGVKMHAKVRLQDPHTACIDGKINALGADVSKTVCTHV